MAQAQLRACRPAAEAARVARDGEGAGEEAGARAEAQQRRRPVGPETPHEATNELNNAPAL